MRFFVAMLAIGAVIAVAQTPQFERVQPDEFSDGGTLVNAWADFDQDGALDLFVGFNGEPNRLYRQESGVFRDVAPDVGLARARATRAAAWGDVDRDGDADILLGFAPGDGPVLQLLRNDGRAFVDITSGSGIRADSGAVRQVSWVDLDADGDLDLFVAFRDRANQLLLNDRGAFRDVAADIGLADTRRTVGAVWFDYDDDGDLDLYVANMDGDANGLFRNDGGRFTDVASASGLAWGGRAPDESTNGTVRPCAADVDNDGRLDLFAANYGPNGLFLNRGGGRFEDVSQAWGIATDARYDSCAFADFDNDGFLDLFVNGTVTGGVSYPDYLYRNTGTGFVDVTPADFAQLEADHGVQWADFDGDGDVDLALTGARPQGTDALLRNGLDAEAAHRSLRVMVLDAQGRAVHAGARVSLLDAASGQHIGTRLVDSGSGYNSQSVVPLHFGLATLTPVHILVTLPGAAGPIEARVDDVDPNAFLGRVLMLHIAADGSVTTTAR